MVPRGGIELKFANVRCCPRTNCKAATSLQPMSSTVRPCMPQSASKCGTKCGTDGVARLTERGVQTAKPGRHSDGDGLQLVVSETGRKKWVLRYQVSGVRKDKGLGAYPAIGLKEARNRASEARKLIARGIDPMKAKELPKGRQAHADIHRDRQARHRGRAKQVGQRESSLPVGTPSRRRLLRSATRSPCK